MGSHFVGMMKAVGPESIVIPFLIRRHNHGRPIDARVRVVNPQHLEIFSGIGRHNRVQRMPRCFCVLSVVCLCRQQEVLSRMKIKNRFGELEISKTS